jgi:two-component system response regulator
LTSPESLRAGADQSATFDFHDQRRGKETSGGGYAIDDRSLDMKFSRPEILLVEDSQEDLDLIFHSLGREMSTKNILIARDGDEALDCLFCRGEYSDRSLENPPRLVLLDLKLPKVDGMEVLRQVKSDPLTRAIPVVVLTSSTEERDLLRSYDLGVNSYIQKPVDFAQFRTTVKQLGLYWLITNQAPVAGKAARAAGQGS